MENKIFFSLVILCVFTHSIRLVFEILKDKKLLEANRSTFMVILPNMMILWISWFALCNFDTWNISIPGVIQGTGLVLVIAGVLLFFISLYTIKSLESYDGDLITTGIYSKLRHPMYLGFIFWLIGFPIFSEAVFSFLLSFVFIANVLFWRHLEEKELEQRFPAYKEYRKTTVF
jgi:protein-S-isoprenylcysteine O-methyltransferase Ste14